MKKVSRKFLNMLAIAVLMMGFTFVAACDDDENDGGSILEEEYFTIENATYHSGDMPASTTSTTFENITINDRALSGGLNFITIVTTTRYKCFYVAVKGIAGYYSYTPTTNNYSYDGTYYIYTIPLLYSIDFEAARHILIISGETEDDEITKPYEGTITYVESQAGDLNINLTFSNAKDVDLHLYMPDNTHIYYNHRTGYFYDEDGETVEFGLDHDSNADCRLDYLNNENIFIPEAAVQAGTYKVVVDMYRNCDRTVATNWSVVARFKGNLLNNTYGQRRNPVSGTYEVNAGNGDMTQVMEFTITESQLRARTRSVKSSEIKFRPSDEAAILKYEEAQWNAAHK